MTACTRDECTDKATRRGLCHRHYMAHWNRERAYGRWESGYIDAQPTREHVERLRAAGLGTRTIAQTAGVTRSILQCLIHGKPRNGRREPPSHTISRRNADKILAVPVPTQPRRIGNVPALGTRRRLRALIANGYSQRDIVTRLGLTSDNLAPLVRGDREFVDPSTAQRIDALFRQLQLTPGTCERSRNRGRANRWPLPLDWDEDRIDDPDHEAERSQARTVVRDPERIEWRKQQVAKLTAAGQSAAEIAALLRCTPRTVVRDRIDLGISERAAS
ncbi:helix-turn-helix DNA binding domain protein [Gordonia phage Santhid]|uniref:Helix-turn-helix DNA binding domain protein n=1 Tax=Gordonia phage Santhid TaxID=2927281 RepID=A0AAE9GS75_9CAUD|nr:helix-turn-helix DNA binding domain protein [Gordonia phage Santhid]UOK18043.1 helix-turn-helix DNA binding domain protein [Gordonia phage Santhid]